MEIKTRTEGVNYRKDLTGHKFNRITVVGFSHRERYRIKGRLIYRYYWKCKCDCGKEIIVLYNNIQNGQVKSCGCLRRKPRTHGFFTTNIIKGESRVNNKDYLFYQKWANTKNKIFNDKNEHYKKYKEKGIKFSKRWLKFENFKKDMYKPYLKHLEKNNQENTTLFRINPHKGFSRWNCRWATKKEQINNIPLTKEGAIYRKRIRNLMEKTNFDYSVLRDKMQRGWSDKEILNHTKFSQKIYSIKNKDIVDKNIKKLDKLSERNAYIMKFRYGYLDGKLHSLKDVGEKLNITRERVRQLEAISLNKIK